MPPSFRDPEARARQRRSTNSTIFETFKAQNAEICTPLRPCPPAALTPEAKARARRSTKIETFRAQNAEICTPPRPCPPATGQKRGQSTGAGEYDFRDRSWTKERPEHQNAEICTPPRRRRCPPAQRPEHGHGAVFSRRSRLKKPEICTPPRPYPETFKAQKAEICTPPGTREYDFRDFQGSKCRNLYSPAPVPPRPCTDRARARGSTIFETFNAQNAEICTPPRPCPPAAWTPQAKARARGSTNFETFKAQNAEICTPAPVTSSPHGPHASLEKLSHHVIHIYAGATIPQTFEALVR